MGAAFSRDTVSVAAARVGFCNHIEAFAGAPPPEPPCKEKYLLPILSCGCPVLFSQLRGQSGPHSNNFGRHALRPAGQPAAVEMAPAI